jgi:hypothetical protein
VGVASCFVVLFASSALRFVRRTKLVCNNPTDAQLVKMTSASPPTRGKDLSTTLFTFFNERGSMPHKPTTFFKKAAFVPNGTAQG